MTWVLERTLDPPLRFLFNAKTCAYDTECGFTKIEPLNFLESYGMYIKKWNIVKPVRKIHLYEPGLGAVYAQGFFKPKRWSLYPITRITHTEEQESQ